MKIGSTRAKRDCGNFEGDPERLETRRIFSNTIGGFTSELDKKSLKTTQSVDGAMGMLSKPLRYSNLLSRTALRKKKERRDLKLDLLISDSGTTFLI